MRGLYEMGLFAFRALAVILFAGAVLEAIEGAWMAVIILGALSVSSAILAALASTEGDDAS